MTEWRTLGLVAALAMAYWVGYEDAWSEEYGSSARLSVDCSRRMVVLDSEADGCDVCWTAPCSC